MLKSTANKLNVKFHRSSVSRYQADHRESTDVNTQSNRIASMHAATVDLPTGVSASEITYRMSRVALVSNSI